MYQDWRIYQGVMFQTDNNRQKSQRAPWTLYKENKSQKTKETWSCTSKQQSKEAVLSRDNSFHPHVFKFENIMSLVMMVKFYSIEANQFQQSDTL